MKSAFGTLISIVLALGLLFSYDCQKARAETARKPVNAGRFYPSDPLDLKQLIDQLTRRAQQSRVQLPAGKHLRAIIMPHAGYIYSGWTAAHAAFVLSARQFSKVVLLGPDHYVGFNHCAVVDAAAYKTPFGEIRLHPDAAKLRRQPEIFQSVPASLDKEHSLEVVLPFLQSYLEEFQLVPVIVGRADTGRLANALDPIIGDDTLLVVSSDLSHFLSYSEAVARDRETIHWILNLEAEKFIAAENRACGAVPIMVLLDLARRHHWQPILLNYANSGDTAGDRSRVVGYAAIAFFGDLPMENKQNANPDLGEEQGQVLVKLARHTIMEKLGRDLPDSESNALATALQDKRFQSRCGTFVTLKIHGQLRGCIGNLSSTESISDGVRRNAANAAFHDPRFAPLSNHELDQTEIEVSILTEPQPLEYLDGQDLVNKLRVNVDGVIIRKGYASATFLPQVWEQLPRSEDFLEHLCMKAGLPSDAWKRSGLEVLTYQVRYFEEKK